jgi:phage terminase large subunit-like protein
LLFGPATGLRRRHRQAWTVTHPEGAEEAHRAIEDAFSTFDVAFLYADPWKWQDELETGRGSPDRVVDFPTNSTRRMAPAVDRFRTAIHEGRVHHAGDPDLTRHVLNARLRKAGRDEDGRGRYTLERAAPTRFIDACVATVLAIEAAAQIEETPEPFMAFAWA